MEQLTAKVVCDDYTKNDLQEIADDAPMFSKELREEREATNSAESILRRNGTDCVTAVESITHSVDFYDPVERCTAGVPLTVSDKTTPEWKWIGNIFISDEAHPLMMTWQDQAVIGVVSEYDQAAADEIVEAIDRAVAHLTHPFHCNPAAKPVVYFVFNTCGGNVSCLEQILDAMDSHRDSVRYVGVVAGHAHSAAISASCGCVHLMACDYVIIDPLARAMMHEVRYYESYGKVTPTEDEHSKLAKQYLRNLTDRMYNDAEVSVLSRLVDEEHKCAVACALRQRTDLVLGKDVFTSDALSQHLRGVYYRRYVLELLHHAKQHLDPAKVLNSVERILQLADPGKQPAC